MKYYIIDGNNLIGKIPALQKLHKNNPQNSREKLYGIISGYFQEKKYEVIIFYDGFENVPLRHSRVKVDYSNSNTADDHVRAYISKSRSRSQITLISSDRALCEFARQCTCKIWSCEEFNDALTKAKEVDAEKEKIRSLSGSNEEFIKLFSQKNKLS
jgi:predicted RNA-binding protein with PIN domain